MAPAALAASDESCMMRRLMKGTDRRRHVVSSKMNAIWSVALVAITALCALSQSVEAANGQLSSECPVHGAVLGANLSAVVTACNIYYPFKSDSQKGCCPKVLTFLQNQLYDANNLEIVTSDSNACGACLNDVAARLSSSQAIDVYSVCQNVPYAVCDPSVIGGGGGQGGSVGDGPVVPAIVPVTANRTCPVTSYAELYLAVPDIAANLLVTCGLASFTTNQICVSPCMTYVSLAITAMAAAGASGTYVSEYVSDCQNTVASILVANGITISAVTKIQQCPLYTPWRVPPYVRPYYLGQQSCNLTAPADLKLYLDAAGVWTNCAASDPTFAGSPHCPICAAAIYRAAIMIPPVNVSTQEAVGGCFMAVLQAFATQAVPQLVAAVQNCMNNPLPASSLCPINGFSGITDITFLQNLDLACSPQALQQPGGCATCRASVMPAVLNVPGIQVWSDQMLANCAQVVGGGYALWRGDNTTTAGIAVTECFEQGIPYAPTLCALNSTATCGEYAAPPPAPPSPPVSRPLPSPSPSPKPCPPPAAVPPPPPPPDCGRHPPTRIRRQQRRVLRHGCSRPRLRVVYVTNLELTSGVLSNNLSPT
ncbi:hypothetical protein KFL_002890110 [Klebsormidium nitens]|uniref:SPARK domain-containing protein n=1 Tax=Klebsormidium nitens TaxID=105231 RepID=A0A1Y1I660_KLENI|nr:hypothetical protein KFL_002890110 [Klebsormidium nitens]|eukprot:GAQ86444.1 hypothetical protein KFL_002890110 [Klebsormidium nitens]